MKLAETWNGTLAFVASLWPQAELNDEILDLWGRRLRNENQIRVQEALRTVRVNYTSRTPELKWVMTEVAAMKRHCGLAEAAKPSKVDDAELRRQVAEDSRMMLGELLRTPDTELAAARRWVHVNVPLPGRSNSSDPHDWPTAYRGYVWGRIQNTRAGRVVNREVQHAHP